MRVEKKLIKHEEIKTKRDIIYKKKESIKRLNLSSRGFDKRNKSLKSITHRSKSKKRKSNESRKKSKDSMIKKDIPKINPEKFQANFKEFQKVQAEKMKINPLESDMYSEETNSYLSRRPKRKKKERVLFNYEKKSEFGYNNVRLQKPKKSSRSYIEKGSFDKKSQFKDQKTNCESIITREQKNSFSTKAITDMQTGGEQDTIDNKQLLKFMVVKKNKIKRIRQQSLMNLADLKNKEKKKKPVELEDMKVENIVIHNFNKKNVNLIAKNKYQNPRNSLVIYKEDYDLKQEESRELISETKNVKLIECLPISNNEQNQVILDSNLNLLKDQQYNIKNEMIRKSKNNSIDYNKNINKNEQLDKIENLEIKIENNKLKNIEDKSRRESSKDNNFIENNDDLESSNEYIQLLKEKLTLIKEENKKHLESLQIEKYRSQLKNDFIENNKIKKEKEPLIKNYEKIKIFKKNEDLIKQANLNLSNDKSNKNNSEEKNNISLSNESEEENEILENIEDMSEADIIKNGQKIILKNLNNKDFIKKILKEVKKIKLKENEETTSNNNLKLEKNEDLSSQKESTLKEDSNLKDSEQLESEKKENLSIITLGSDSDEFSQEDNEEIINEFFHNNDDKIKKDNSDISNISEQNENSNISNISEQNENSLYSNISEQNENSNSNNQKEENETSILSNKNYQIYKDEIKNQNELNSIEKFDNCKNNSKENKIFDKQEKSEKSDIIKEREEVEKNNTNSVQLTEMTDESLFRWNSNYNNDSISIKENSHLNKIKLDEEEQIIPLKVIQYQGKDETNKIFNQQLRNRSGTFKKKNISKEQNNLNGLISPEEGKNKNKH